MTRSRVLAWMLGMLLVVGGSAVVHLPHGAKLGEDDHAQYLLHARALARGTPYTDIGFIHTPYTTMVAPLAEPPGLPALIAGVFRVAGEQRGAERAIIWVAFALWVVLVFRYLARDTAPWMAASVTLIAALPLLRLHALDNMLADVPFMAAWWAVMLLAEHGPWVERRRIGLLLLFGAMAFSFRMAALPLLPAAATLLLLRDRTERRGIVLAGLGWTMAAALVMFGLPSASVLAGETVRGASQIVTDARLNVVEVLQGLRVWMPGAHAPHLARQAMHASLLGLAAIGVVAGARRRWRSFAWIAGAWYLAMLLLIPTRAERYVWPLLPLVALAIIEGTQRLAGWLRLPAATHAVAAGVLVIAGIQGSLRAPAPESWDVTPDVVSMTRALHSVADSVGAERMAIVSFSPRVMTWEEGYRSMPHFIADETTMLAVMDSTGITHVVTGDRGTDSEAFALDSLILHRPDRFAEIYRNPSFRVLRLIPGAR